MRGTRAGRAWVIPRPDVDAQIGRVYTSGPVGTAELIYDFITRKGARARGFT